LWLAGGIPSRCGRVLPPGIFAAFVAGLVVDGSDHWTNSFCAWTVARIFADIFGVFLLLDFTFHIRALIRFQMRVL
jgi:protein involved in ribonucleotide reduction